MNLNLSKTMMLMLPLIMSVMESGCGCLHYPTPENQPIKTVMVLPRCDQARILLTNLTVPTEQRHYLFTNGQVCQFTH